MEDILDEYISPEAARRDYGVIWDEKLGKVDLEATKKLREELAAKRKEIYIDQATRPYAQIEKRILTYEEMGVKGR
jgi:hypothetical protein